MPDQRFESGLEGRSWVGPLVTGSWSPGGDVVAPPWARPLGGLRDRSACLTKPRLVPTRESRRGSGCGQMRLSRTHHEARSALCSGTSETGFALSNGRRSADRRRRATKREKWARPRPRSPDEKRDFHLFIGMVTTMARVYRSDWPQLRLPAALRPCSSMMPSRVRLCASPSRYRRVPSRLTS